MDGAKGSIVFPLSWKVEEYSIIPSTQTSITDLVDAWKKAGKKSDKTYVNSNITDANFPTNTSNLPQNNQRYVLANFGKPMTTKQAQQAGLVQGLKLPTIQDGINFATLNPDIQRERWIVVPHEPWRGSDGNLYVLSLYGNSANRSLCLNGYDDVWNSDFWFLFARG